MTFNDSHPHPCLPGRFSDNNQQRNRRTTKTARTARQTKQSKARRHAHLYNHAPIHQCIDTSIRQYVDTCKHRYNYTSIRVYIYAPCIHTSMQLHTYGTPQLYIHTSKHLFIFASMYLFILAFVCTYTPMHLCIHAPEHRNIVDPYTQNNINIHMCTHMLQPCTPDLQAPRGGLSPGGPPPRLWACGSCRNPGNARQQGCIV